MWLGAQVVGCAGRWVRRSLCASGVVAEKEVVVGVVWEEVQEAKAVTAVEMVARVVAFVAEQCVLHE